MPIIPDNDLLVKAQTLKQDALKILNNPESSAEDLDNAEKMLGDAKEMGGRSARLAALRGKANDLLNSGFQPDGDGDSEDGVRDEKQHGGRGGSGKDDAPKHWGKHFGKFLTSVKGAEKGRVDPRLKYFEPEGEAKDLAESAGSTGGYLVPVEFMPTLMQQVEERAIVRPRAMVIPMTRRTIEVPALKQDGTTAGQPHWFGGMLAFWEAEAANIAETEPAFRNITLTAHELTAVTHVSNNLLADSAVSLSALLTGARGFPGVIAWKEDDAFLNGSGAGEPLGVLNAPATLAVARTTALQVKYDDLANMMGKFLDSGNGIWVAHISVKAALMLMNGPAGNPSYLWGNASQGIPDQLLGYPIVFTEKVSALGTRGDIGLYDFGHYYVGDRQSTTIESSDQARWLKNQTSWKVVHRVDGQPWLNLPFTLKDGTTQISPFVTLAT